MLPLPEEKSVGFELQFGSLRRAERLEPRVGPWLAAGLETAG